MANKTNSIASVFFEKSGDRVEAQEYFKKQYPEIKYVPDTDSFSYRGYKFDYFKSGIGVTGCGNSYILIDKNDSQLWLYTYGNLEDRWNDFISSKNRKAILK